MRRGMQVIVGLGLLGAIGVAVGIRGAGGQPSKPELDRSAASMAAIEERLARVEQEAEQRRTAASPRPMAPPTAADAKAEAATDRPAATDADEGEAPPALPTTPEEERERSRQVKGRMANQFAAERPDPAWRRAVEADLEHTFAEQAAKSEFYVERMECRSTLCQISVRSPSMSAQEEFMTRTAGMPGFTHAGAAFREADERTGEVHTTIYLLRNEADLAAFTSRPD